jgi:hypothetical protein
MGVLPARRIASTAGRSAPSLEERVRRGIALVPETRAFAHAGGDNLLGGYRRGAPPRAGRA